VRSGLPAGRVKAAAGGRYIQGAKGVGRGRKSAETWQTSFA
jgi:hypothetical protein